MGVAAYAFMLVINIMGVKYIDQREKSSLMELRESTSMSEERFDTMSARSRWFVRYMFVLLTGAVTVIFWSGLRASLKNFSDPAAQSGKPPVDSGDSRKKGQKKRTLYSLGHSLGFLLGEKWTGYLVKRNEKKG